MKPPSHHFRTPFLLIGHACVTPDEILEFQGRQLRRLVRHAYARVPHYRRLLDRHGLHPGDIRGVGDLDAIPITSKNDLRNRPLNEVLSRGSRPDRLIRRMTSGSSGMPFTIYRSAFEDHLIQLFRVQAYRQYGLRVSDRIAVVAETPLAGTKRRLLSRIKEVSRIYRTFFIDCHGEDGRILDELARIRPDAVIGYPSNLAQLGARLAGETRPRVRPRRVLTGGGVMTLPMRRRIEEGFGSRVYDIYGAHEVNILAWECPRHGAYHVSEANVIVEILKDGRPAAAGEAGEVVATGLHTLAMPFIRYRMGDIATRGSAACACGWPFPTIQHIQGRTIDYFRLPGGRRVHPFTITGPLIQKDSLWVCRHQLVQEAENHIVLRIQPFHPPRRQDLDRLQRLGQDKVGADTRFSVELVETFAIEEGKKFPPYISRIEGKSDIHTEKRDE